MKKIKLYLVLLTISISSLFLITGIYGIFTKDTSSNINKLTISQETSYTVVHETMNIDGTTYTERSRTNYPNVPIGTVVSPEVLTIDGFNSPSVETVARYSPVLLNSRP